MNNEHCTAARDPRVPAPFFPAGIDYGDRAIKNYWVDPLSLVPAGRGLVLDLGCGGPATRAALEGKGYTWVGLDIAPLPGVTAVGDAHGLPFEPATFSTVYSAQLFKHLADPWRAAQDVFRVLRPGGVFCGSVSCLEPFHDSFFNYSHWGLETLLRRAGFVPTRIEAGPSAFLVMLHHLVDGAGSQLSMPIAKLTVRPLLSLLRGVGTVVFLLRYGRNSPQMRQLDGYFAKFGLRFAGHLLFVAQKPPR